MGAFGNLDLSGFGRCRDDVLNDRTYSLSATARHNLALPLKQPASNDFQILSRRGSRVYRSKVACTQNKPGYKLASFQVLDEPVPIPGPSLFEALRLGLVGSKSVGAVPCAGLESCTKAGYKTLNRYSDSGHM